MTLWISCFLGNHKKIFAIAFFKDINNIIGARRWKNNVMKSKVLRRKRKCQSPRNREIKLDVRTDRRNCKKRQDKPKPKKTKISRRNLITNFRELLEDRRPYISKWKNEECFPKDLQTQKEVSNLNWNTKGCQAYIIQRIWNRERRNIVKYYIVGLSTAKIP